MNESEFVRILESFYDSKTGGEKTFRLGKISPTYTSGLPKVLLDGDDGVGDVTYPHLFSYTPSANDRVLLIRFGTSYLILGKINNDGSPSGGGEFDGTIDWGNVTGKPSTFTPSAHTHSWLDVTGKPTTFTPSAHTHSISDVDNLQTELDGKASSSHTHSWSSITSKPSTFAPSAHSHSISEVTGLQTALDGKASTSHSHSWSDITSKPSTFTPSAHTHSVSDLTNFPTQTGNSGKFLTTNGTTLSWATVATSSGDWADITNKPTTFPPSAHTHAWSEITGKPTTFTPSTHTHAWADITGKPTTFTPSTHTHTVSQVSDFPSQTSNTGKLLTTNGTTLSWTSFTLEGMETWNDVLGKPNSISLASHTHDWIDVTGKPSTFTPSAHNHPISDVTGLQTALDGKSATGHSHSWSEITGKPSTFTPSSHTHAISDVTNLQTALDGKSDSGHTHSWSSITSKPTTFPPESHSHSWTEITGKPTTFAPSTHSHSWSEITDKPTTFTPSTHSHSWSEITSKPTTFAPSAHSHAISDVTNLQTTLDGKASSSHSHSWSEITSKPSTFTPSAHTHTVSDLTNFPSQTGNSGKMLVTDGTNLSWATPPTSGGGSVDWANILNKPSTFTPSTHTHSNATTSVAGFMSTTDKSKLDGIATGANNYVHPTSDGNKHVPANGTSNNNKVLKATATAGTYVWGSVDWSEITGKPSTFTPATHTHLWADITDKPSTFAPSAHTHSWSEITDKPSTFTPSSHSHSISDVTNLQTELNSKATLGSGINGVLTHDYGYFYLKKYSTASSHSGFGQMARIYYSGASSTNSIYFQVVKDDNSVTYAKLVALSFDLSSKEENKKDIVELEDGMLDKILQAKAYKYRFRDADDGRDRLGLVIGRETPEEVISAGGETVDIYSFATMLMKAMQEQQEQIEDLKRRLDELERG